MMSQNSEDPTGVSAPERKHNAPGTSVARARQRKANAAIQLALAGATWDEVAEVVGYPTARTARVAVERALEKQLTDSDSREKMRKMAGARLDRLLRSVWPKAIDPNHPDHLMAIARAKDVIDRHAKLYGLDAPTELIVHTPTQIELEAWAARVMTVLNPSVAEYDILDAEIVGELDAVPAE